MKQFFFTVFVLSATLSFSQPLVLNVISEPAKGSANDTIYYQPGSKLVWNNFFTRNESSGDVAALTASGFGFKASMSYKNGKGNISVFTYCFFSRSNSWVRPNRKTDYILSHEQHHFDISYIGMQLFAHRLRQTNFTVQNYSALLHRIYNESYQYMSDLQNRYDGETKNGQLPDKQAQWIKSIDSWLGDLNE
jgi:hypothetical protein